MTTDVLRLVLVAAAAGLLFEVLPFAWRPFWDSRRLYASIAVVANAIAAGSLLFARPNAASAGIAFIMAYRVINDLRIVQGRMHEDYLRHAAWRTLTVMIGFQAVVLLGWWLQARFDLLTTQEWLFIWMMAAYVFAGVLMLSLVRRLAVMKPRPLKKHLSDNELPTVTVCIPARNENADLTACLQTVLASNYPKLEVLVYDDCSHKNISLVIRDFAHKGVRFIRSDSVKQYWLAKNQAYDALADQASGKLVLFCGVDVRLGPRAIRELVSTMLVRKKKMVSVLPERIGGGLDVTLVQPMRYWWELALPRRMFNRPPVLSTCWIIEKAEIKKLGGFDSVSRAVLPETVFARELVRQDAYSFVRSHGYMLVATVKSWHAQRDTAIRVRYPQVRRRPEWTALITAGLALFQLAPVALAIAGFFTPLSDMTHLLALECLLLLLTIHVTILVVTNPGNWWAGLINYPFAIATELALGNISMWKYEFSEVLWKGRNVCLPVMHVTPRLPKV